jgi:hypothetical protein
MLFMNESPRWLVEKNKLSQAAKALAHVRGKSVEDAEVVQELDEIIADFNGHEKMPMIAQLKSACSSKKMLYRSSFVVILMFWQQWTGKKSEIRPASTFTDTEIEGTNSINYYAPQIFKQIGLTGNSSGLFVSDSKRVQTSQAAQANVHLGDWSIRHRQDRRDSDWPNGLHRATWAQMVVDPRLDRPSVCDVLHWRQPGSPPTHRRAGWQRNLRHRLRLSLCCLLLFRVGTDPIRAGIRVQPEPRTLSAHGGLADDAVAL